MKEQQRSEGKQERLNYDDSYSDDVIIESLADFVENSPECSNYAPKNYDLS